MPIREILCMMSSRFLLRFLSQYAVFLTLAPILGDVLTIRKPLARYRLHDASYSAMRSLDASKLRERLLQDVEKARFFASVSRQLRLPYRSIPSAIV